MNPLFAFGWGCAGNIAVEIVLFCNAVRQSRSGRVPVLYRNPAFVIARILLGVVGGLIAAAWGITLPLQGFALGAAAPRLVLSLARLRLPPPGGGRKDHPAI